MRRRLLDRLGATLTRRQALKSALAGAALTLPLGREVAIAQGGPHDCQKGCDWTVDRRFKASLARCGQEHGEAAVLIWWAPVAAVVHYLDSRRCYDTTILTHKAGHYDCFQPGCPGFDPKAPGGPCDTCADNCCPCQASPNGYICCIFPCNDPDHNCCPGG